MMTVSDASAGGRARRLPFSMMALLAGLLTAACPGPLEERVTRPADCERQLTAACPGPLEERVSRPEECERADCGPRPAPPRLRRRWTPPKPTHVGVAPHNVAGLFAVKFVEGSHIRLSPDGFYIDRDLRRRAPDEALRLDRLGLTQDILERTELRELNNLVRLYERAYGFRPSYAFPADGSRDGLDGQFRQKDELEQRSGEELADLHLYYLFEAPPGFRDARVQERFMNDLNRIRAVEQVYPLGVADTAQVPSPDISASQSYLDAAPAGVGARLAWAAHPASRGAGVRLADVEYDWVVNHEDFPPEAARYEGGRPLCPYVASETEHGTAVMGIIAAPHNGLGISGIAPDIDHLLVSFCRPLEYVIGAHVAAFSGESFAGRTHNFGIAAAIYEASRDLRPGDVLLVENQVPGPSTGLMTCAVNCSQFEQVAMEYYQESFDVIRRLTSRGVIVVEVAGNGSVSLDSPAHAPRFDPATRHSGALLVGSAEANIAVPSSNTGSRIDLYSWGRNIVTIGYGTTPGLGSPFSNTEPDRLYRADFGGTSGAAAIVAGVVASLQGARLGAGEPVMMPRRVREILFTTGTPQAPATPGATILPAESIGRQPDLLAAIPQALAPVGGFGGPGDYVIQPRSSDKVLDVDVSWLRGQYDGQSLIQWQHHGGQNQIFRVSAVPGIPGQFTINPLHSPKCLAVAAPLMGDRAPVVQFECQPVDHQRFRIVQDGSSYRIVAVHSGMALTVSGDSRDNGARIVQRILPPFSVALPEQLFEFIAQ